MHQVLDFHGWASPATPASSAGRRALRGLSIATMSLGVAALMLNTACYSYVATPPQDLAAGQKVYVSVNNAGRDILAKQDVGDSVDIATGTFVSNDVAGIHMNVTNVLFQSEISSPRAAVPVTLPVAAVDSVTTRNFSAASTGWLVLAIAAGVFAMVKAINVNSSGTVPPPPGKGPPDGAN
jgi:hypothetical protein